MIRALHMVMNPRAIPECMDSFADLDVDTCYFRGMRQEELIPHVAEVVAETEYSAYLMSSDDCIVSQEALDAVLALLEDGHPAVTGWCRLDRTHEQVNLCPVPLRGDTPRTDAYTFYDYSTVAEWPDEAVPTHLMGMALTGMTREMWLRFPYGCYGIGAGGWASDFNLSVRLRDAGIPMVAARGGYVEHVKERVGHLDADPVKRLLIGEINPEIVMVTAAAVT